MEQQTAIPSLPPFPEDATFTAVLMWIGNFILWLVYNEQVRDVIVGICIPLIGQIVAVTFGEVLKIHPRMVALKESRVGEWKFWLRTGPILVGALATFLMLFDYYDIPWKAAGSWGMLALLNGAAAWPVFDRVVEPYLLPWLYAKLAKWSGKPPRVVPPEEGEEVGDETVPQRRLRELNEKLSKKDDPPPPT